VPLELTKMTEVNAAGTARLFEVIRTDGLDINLGYIGWIGCMSYMS
jgi:hypothetical protein